MRAEALPSAAKVMRSGVISLPPRFHPLLRAPPLSLQASPRKVRNLSPVLLRSSAVVRRKICVQVYCCGQKACSPAKSCVPVKAVHNVQEVKVADLAKTKKGKSKSKSHKKEAALRESSNIYAISHYADPEGEESEMWAETTTLPTATDSTSTKWRRHSTGGRYSGRSEGSSRKSASTRRSSYSSRADTTTITESDDYSESAAKSATTRSSATSRRKSSRRSGYSESDSESSVYEDDSSSDQNSKSGKKSSRRESVTDPNVWQDPIEVSSVSTRDLQDRYYRHHSKIASSRHHREPSATSRTSSVSSDEMSFMSDSDYEKSANEKSPKKILRKSSGHGWETSASRSSRSTVTWGHAVKN